LSDHIVFTLLFLKTQDIVFFFKSQNITRWSSKKYWNNRFFYSLRYFLWIMCTI